MGRVGWGGVGMGVTGFGQVPSELPLGLASREVSKAAGAVLPESQGKAGSCDKNLGITGKLERI